MLVLLSPPLTDPKDCPAVDWKFLGIWPGIKHLDTSVGGPTRRSNPNPRPTFPTGFSCTPENPMPMIGVSVPGSCVLSVLFCAITDVHGGLTAADLAEGPEDNCFSMLGMGPVVIVFGFVPDSGGKGKGISGFFAVHPKYLVPTNKGGPESSIEKNVLLSQYVLTLN
jgi:hypothetical protein